MLYNQLPANPIQSFVKSEAHYERSIRKKCIYLTEKPLHLTETPNEERWK